jgi:hypothetical protein
MFCVVGNGQNIAKVSERSELASNLLSNIESALSFNPHQLTEHGNTLASPQSTAL